MAFTQHYLAPSQTPTYHVARAALEAGIGVLPIRFDGTKQPALAGWKRYQEKRPTLAEMGAWFRDPQYGRWSDHWICQWRARRAGFRRSPHV